MSSYKKQNKHNRGQAEQDKMARSVDQLQEFDDFCNTILPKLRALLADDKSSSDDVMKFAEKDMAARMVTIALSEKDPKVAMQAIKDVFDRTRGKAKETLSITSRYEELTDEELDALVKSEQDSLNEDFGQKH